MFNVKLKLKKKAIHHIRQILTGISSLVDVHYKKAIFPQRKMKIVYYQDYRFHLSSKSYRNSFSFFGKQKMKKPANQRLLCCSDRHLLMQLPVRCQEGANLRPTQRRETRKSASTGEKSVPFWTPPRLRS